MRLSTKYQLRIEKVSSIPKSSNSTILDSLYLIQLQMGTPPQNFTVQLDTGSADAWVIDSNCDSLQCRGRAGQKHRFNKSSSRTFAEDGHEFLIEYNHRGVEGKIGKDKMQVFKNSKFLIPN